tara:strand:- start:172 stop:600 length:429 start_codon:yes stop_codon:yes gene_type:complete
MSEILKKVAHSLGRKRLSVVDTAHLIAQIVQHTSSLKWKYDRYTESWSVEKRNNLKSHNPYTYQKSKSLIRKVLKDLFKSRVFVRVERIQDHRLVTRPLVSPGESIFVVLNALPEFHASPITVNGCQYITVTQTKKNNFICG